MNSNNEDERRTQDEIIHQFLKIKPDDPFNFESGQYVRFMDYENATKFGKVQMLEEEWKKQQLKPDKKVLIDMIKEEMPQALKNCNTERLVPMTRCVLKFAAWIWMFDEKLVEDIKWEFNQNDRGSGKCVLVKICEKIGLDHEKIEADESLC